MKWIIFFVASLTLLPTKSNAFHSGYQYSGSVFDSTIPFIPNGTPFTASVILDDSPLAFFDVELPPGEVQVRFYLSAGMDGIYGWGAPDGLYDTFFDPTDIGGGISGDIEDVGYLLGIQATNFDGVGFENVNFYAGYSPSYYYDNAGFLLAIGVATPAPDDGNTGFMLLGAVMLGCFMKKTPPLLTELGASMNCGSLVSL